ncbi:hypothetical protein [Nitrococcus mobilis]|uniref:Uncharacterized protein n=1 Tax=Nitrococcus mobilis Nb-231 TaxID=314278 RepID=A4BUR3_9GAMM|nr:hypothetical protein [Nitrococcus mobilis]EAR20517.1 hypothetical protein NB231_01663 [Nitrococcus mobilis Nb-231]
MANIMIRDLNATETLDRQASLRVKGGWYGGHLMPHMHHSLSLDKKFTKQIQVAQVNNTAVGIKGPGVFNLNGTIVQSQSA